MKKLLTTLVLIFAIASITKAQDCKCNPNGFNPFEFSTLGETTKVKSGHQFSLKCKQPFKFNGGYKCDYNLKICDVKFKATIKNSAGAVVKNYPNFNFPLDYEFETGGNFVLEITPYCGKLACPSAKFFFTVYCDAKPTTTCKCNDKNGWVELSTVFNGAKKPTKCGEKFEIKKTDKFGLKGTFKCVGDCAVVLKGSIVSETNGNVENFPSITLDGTPLRFPGAGSYKLIVTPVCNNKECEPCIFYVNVN